MSSKLLAGKYDLEFGVEGQIFSHEKKMVMWNSKTLCNILLQCASENVTCQEIVMRCVNKKIKYIP